MLNAKLLTAIVMIALLAMVAMRPVHAADGPGMVVVRDAKTGQLRAPTAAELRDLRANAPRNLAPASSAPVERRANGALHKHLGDQAQVFTVVTRDADGKFVSECVQGEQAAAAAVDHPHDQQEHRHEDR